ncbi:MAG: cache domain-containing protein, partial [Bacillota bacterium]|nr:cache domain-containing protein [Bacillota bacterium]
MKHIIQKTKPILAFSKKNIVHILSVLTILSLLLPGYSLYCLIYEKDKQIDDATKQLEAQTELASKKIDETLKEMKETTCLLSKKISDINFNKCKIEQLLKSTLEEKNGIFGVGAAYNTEVIRYAPYWYREDGHLKFSDDAIKSYTNETWYKECIDKKTGWFGPYFGMTSSKLIVKYYMPIYETKNKTKEKRIIGTVYVNQSLDYIGEKLRILDLGKSGYLFVMNGKNFIFHPLKSFVQESYSTYGNAKTDKMGETYIKFSNSTSKISNDPYYNKNSIHFKKTIGSTGWSITTVSFLNGILDIHIQRQLPISISLGLLLFLMLASLQLLYAFDVNNKSKKTAIIYSIIVLSGIFSICYNSECSTDFKNNIVQTGQTIILNKTDMEIFKEKQKPKRDKSPISKLVFIPTGIYIQSVKMTDTYEATVTGYIWQKYNTGNNPWGENGILKGFDLPESVGDNDVIKDPYESAQENGVKTLCWKFKVVLRQEFDYSKYPFDTKDVWIRIRYKSFDKNVVLIPDLEAYTLYNPAVKPGISDSIQLEGFEPEFSYFHYQTHHYDTDFGIPKDIGITDSPELYYSIIIKRDFKDPFIKYILQIIVMFCILFAILITVNKDENGKVKLGNFDFSGLLAACAGLLFSVILAHIDLRGNFKVQQIMYIEYFYMILYIAILMVVVDGYLFAISKGIWFIEYKNNLIPKYLF